MLTVRHSETTTPVAGYMRLTATLDVDGRAQEVWLLLPDLGPPVNDDWLLPLALVVGMAKGRPVHVEGAVSARLLEAMPGVQRHMRGYYDGIETIPVSASRPGVYETHGTREASLFSCGLDSFYSALELGDVVTDLVYAHGFDRVPADGHLFALLPHVQSAADQLGKRLLRMDSNYWHVVEPLHPLRMSSHVLLPISGLFALNHTFRRLYVPACHDAGYEQRRTTTVTRLLPLWSTDSLDVVQHGVATRVHKVEQVAQSDLAMRYLRSCWVDARCEWQCGTCAKCVRTRINFELAGASGRCPSLPRRLPMHLVQGQSGEGRNAGAYFMENLDEARARGRADLVEALEAAMAGRPPAPTWTTRAAHHVRRRYKKVRRWVRTRRLRGQLKRHRALHGDAPLITTIEAARRTR